MFQAPAFGRFEGGVFGPGLRVGKPTVSCQPGVEDLAADEAAAIDADGITGFPGFEDRVDLLEISFDQADAEFVVFRSVALLELGRKLRVDAVDAKIDRASSRLSERLGQCECSLGVGRSSPGCFEGLHAVVVVLKHDGKAELVLPDPSQFLPGQGFAGESFIGPVVVADDGRDADRLDAFEESVINLVGNVGGAVAFSCLALRCLLRVHGA